MINLLENFGCQVFQTLPKSVLQETLPANIDIIQPGIHLNRVSSLRQVYNFHQDHVDPGKAAEWAQSVYELSNSSDPEIVAYFQQ